MAVGCVANSDQIVEEIMTQRKRYALVGTGGRAGMFVDAITTTYKDVAELVDTCQNIDRRIS